MISSKWLTLFFISNSLAGAGEITTDLALTSNYIYRGESLSSNKPALQSSLIYHDNTALDFGTFISSGDKEMPLEIDLYAEYTKYFNDAIHYMVKSTGYLYPYKASDNSFDIELGLQWSSALLQYSYDFVLNQHYAELKYDQVVSENITAFGRAGILYRKDTNQSHAGSDMDKNSDKNIYDFELGLAYTIDEHSLITASLVYQEVEKTNFAIAYHWLFDTSQGK